MKSARRAVPALILAVTLAAAGCGMKDEPISSFLSAVATSGFTMSSVTLPAAPHVTMPAAAHVTATNVTATEANLLAGNETVTRVGDAPDPVSPPVTASLPALAATAPPATGANSENSANSESGVTAEVGTTTGTADAGSARQLQVAFVYAGRVADGAWTAAHERGRKYMEAELGSQVTSKAVENTPQGVAGSQVLRDLATQGAKLVFDTEYGDGEAMAVLAKDFSDVKWEHAGGAEAAGNLRGHDVRAYQASYLAGIIAGKLTRTDTLGFVASVPIPAVMRNINAFTLGAQSVNPSVRTKVVWVNGWRDAGRESEAAQSLINGGADVLLQSTDSTSPLQVAERAGKYAFGWGSDMQSFGPKAHLGSVVVNWGPYYSHTVRQVLDGSWRPQSSWWGLAEGAVDLARLSDVVPPDVKVLVEEKRKAIVEGELRIWKGPMISSEDREVLATGVIGDDRFIRSVMFFVKGVEGKLPSRN